VIWEACRGAEHIAPLRGILFRLVESQVQIATLGYVDTLEEQAMLEDLLEAVKQPCPAVSGDYHYLLKTPFRYPPLPWGSRFGRSFEPGIFYGGSSVGVSLAESAFYRFIFWSSMDGAPVKSQIRTEHTLFSVGYDSPRGVQLQTSAFAKYQATLKDAAHYLPCQQLGSAMRTAGVEAFEYPSARDPAQGNGVGLFSPAAFAQQRPLQMNQWLCETSASDVAFKQVGSSDVQNFSIGQFLVHGQLPQPA
jgi:hypothetical protein